MGERKYGVFNLEDLRNMHPDKLFRAGDATIRDLIAAAEGGGRGALAKAPAAASRAPAAEKASGGKRIDEDARKRDVVEPWDIDPERPLAKVAVKPWRIQGDWFDVCNCSFLCPCEWAEMPTLGYCEGLMCWRIREGHFGEVRLDDLAVVGVVHFVGTVMEQNREFGWCLPDRATRAQIEALRMIFSGRAGGRFRLWHDFTIKTRGVKVVPLEMGITADEWRVRVPELLEGLAEPFRELMVPRGEVTKIINVPRPEAGPGPVIVGRALKNICNAFGHRWNWNTRSSKMMPLDFSGPGEFTWREPHSETNR